MRRLVSLLSVVLALLGIGPVHVVALPSAPGPIGGLTAVPPTSFGPNLLQDSGFESLSGGLPAAWSSGAGWSADQLVAHSGRASYRRAAGADTSTQTVQLKAGTYLLSAWIKSDGLGSGATSGVRLTLDFRPGGINAWRPSEVISGTNDWQLYQVGPIVIETDRTAAVLLENYNGAAGTAWFDDVSLVQILPAPVDGFLLYPNYRGLLFDDQPQTIQLDVTVTPPGDRKSTRLNSSHSQISYAVFCLKNKTNYLASSRFVSNASRSFTKARMIAMFTFTARSLLKTLDTIATPCSFNAYGR